MFWGKYLCLAAIVAASIIGTGSRAQAFPIDYTFHVDITNGPLAGQMENGSFAYDSSSITPGLWNLSAGLLTSLSFSLNGLSYDATTANTGGLAFDLAGNLETTSVHPLFGNDCSAATCKVAFSTNDWYVEGPAFTYSIPGSIAFHGTVTYLESTIPEPSTFALLAASIPAIGFAGRRRLAGR